ncbi:MAG: hypothetical protein QNJ97_13930 [Myxococcota bacterium]|nr:hypothetical protein [Myxococcota bacterium]
MQRALRDVAKKPGTNALMLFVLFAVSCVVSTPLFLTESIVNAIHQALDRGPDIAIKRVDAGCLSPMDTAHALQKTRSVRGVVSAQMGNNGAGAGNIGQAIEVDVFHDAESTAILPDLAEALHSPMRAITREDGKKRFADILWRHGTLLMVVAVPAVLGLVLLAMTAAGYRNEIGRHMGLLKALGWRTQHMVRVRLFQGLIIGIPGAAAGLAASAMIVFKPNGSLLGGRLLCWQLPSDVIAISVGGVMRTIFVVLAVVVVPWLLAALWPVFRAATVDPSEMLK